MAISNVTTDYSNRTLDVHIFQGVNPYGAASVDPSFGRISNYCTGVQKLVQRYAILLLTTLGSQPNFPDFGTALLTNITQTTYNLNNSDLGHLFNFASAKVIGIMQNYQRANKGIPEDEQLNTAVLNNVSFSNGTVYFDVQIYPVNRDALSFVLPLPLT